jgi:putative endonuclease
MWFRYVSQNHASLLNHRLEQENFMAWMYILECCDSSYYVGSTKDLKLRLSQHQDGKGSVYTSGRLPVKLVYCEESDRVADAFYREKQVQGWTRRKCEALINGTPELLPALAKKIFDRKRIDEIILILDQSGG